MDAESIDIAQGSRNPTLSEEVHQGMDAFRVIDMKVPEHGVIWNVRPRVSLMTPVHRWELDGVPDEEDREVIEHEILDSFIGVELGRPTSHISNRITGALFPAYGRDSGEKLGLLPDASQEGCVGQVRDILQDFEFAEGACGFGMNAPISQCESCHLPSCLMPQYGYRPLRNALTGKVSQDLDCLNITEDNQATIRIAISNLLD